MESQPRTPYPTDVWDDGWDFVAPHPMLMRPNAPRRARGFQRAAVDRPRRGAVAPAAARVPALAGRLPADPALIEAGCFADTVHDLRALGWTLVSDAHRALALLATAPPQL